MGLTLEIGAQGERIAVKYLREHGFLIHDLNWRAGRYEIDVIAERWGVLHFVEVKTRRSSGWSKPEDAITKEKFSALRHAASSYIAQKRFFGETQFDLIAVEMQGDVAVEIRYIEKAMQCSW
ncbi:MAG: YraN family protein [Rikenellaceae bacterium]